MNEFSLLFKEKAKMLSFLFSISEYLLPTFFIINYPHQIYLIRFSLHECPRLQQQQPSKESVESSPGPLL
jgi:hypothetical protein